MSILNITSTSKCRLFFVVAYFPVFILFAREFNLVIAVVDMAPKKDAKGGGGAKDKGGKNAKGGGGDAEKGELR